MQRILEAWKYEAEASATVTAKSEAKKQLLLVWHSILLVVPSGSMLCRDGVCGAHVFGDSIGFSSSLEYNVLEA